VIAKVLMQKGRRQYNKLKFIIFCVFLCHFNVFAKRPEYIIEIKNHLFYPDNFSIPENTKVKFIVINYDQTPEQFDSFDLNREKVIFAGKKATIFIGPLSAGKYYFFGEYHPDNARGFVIVDNDNISTNNLSKKYSNNVEVNDVN